MILGGYGPVYENDIKDLQRDSITCVYRYTHVSHTSLYMILFQKDMREDDKRAKH